MSKYLLCSNCFENTSLKNQAEKIGVSENKTCGGCKIKNGLKLNHGNIVQLINDFFVYGPNYKTGPVTAPTIKFKDSENYIDLDINISESYRSDILILQKCLKIQFFYYAPPLYSVGINDYLEDLEEDTNTESIFKNIIDLYPSVQLDEKQTMYRCRLNIDEKCLEPSEYDAPPKNIVAREGRFSDANNSILYCSQNLQILMHECRVKAEDSIYIATLKPNKPLILIDLTKVVDDNKTPHESIDMALHILFLSGKEQYHICRKLASYISHNGYDGIIYPSYYGYLSNGTPPFESYYGLSLRSLVGTKEYENSKKIPNIALFGRPIEDKKLDVTSIDKVFIRSVEYDCNFSAIL